MKFSIIIPCYNSARFIDKTLTMLISQNLSEVEIIIINDGSLDNTSEIVHSYEKSDSSIRIIDKQNEGVSVARNVGIKEAKGDYVIFLDSDDSFQEGTLDFYREIITNNSDYCFYGFGYKSCDENGRMIYDYSYDDLDGKIFDSVELRKLFLTKKVNFHICSCIYSRQFLINEKIEFIKGLSIGEDIRFLLDVMAKVKNCIYFSRKCYIYQIRDDSVMGGYKFKSFELKNFKSYEIRKNRVLEEDYQTVELEAYSIFWLCTTLS